MRRCDAGVNIGMVRERYDGAFSDGNPAHLWCRDFVWRSAV